MKYFINKYDSGKRSDFLGFIEHIAFDSVHLLGNRGSGGTMTKIDLNGDVVLGLAYTIKGKKITIYKYANCPGGDLILYGRMVVTGNSKRNDHFLLRINATGQPIWAKKYHSDKSRYVRDITRVGDDEYAVVGWYNRAGTQDEVEIIKITGDGTVVASKRIRLGTDVQVYKITPYLRGLAIVGGTNAGSPWDGFIIMLDHSLNIYNSLLLDNADGYSVDDIYFAVQDETKLLLSGRSKVKSEYKTFLSFIGTDIVSADGNIFKEGVLLNIVAGDEQVTKVLRVWRDYYLLGYGSSTKINFVLKFSITSVPDPANPFDPSLKKDLRLVWAKTFDLDSDYILHDIILKNEGELWLSGEIVNERLDNEPLLIKTDLELTSCKTIDLDGVAMGPFEFDLKGKDYLETVLDILEEPYDLVPGEVLMEKVVICPEKTFEYTENAWVQSPYLYLQSAGSLGNESAAGLLLRWFLLRNLGDLHLPKGDYAGTTNNFNKPNDYVCIYRAAYNVKIQKTLSIANDIPIVVNNSQKLWVYKLADNTLFYVLFHDFAKYNNVAATISPQNDSYNFLKAYSPAVFEIEIRDYLAFSMEYQVTGSNLLTVKTELVSVEENLPLSDTAVTGRFLYKLSDINPANITLPLGETQYGENIKSVRISIENGELQQIAFETYTDFLQQKVNTSGWTSLGAFALTKDTNEAFKRLEDPGRFQVNAHWQKFNDDAFVNVQNYKDRWSMPNEGLAAGVAQYISLSDTDPQAVANLQGTIQPDDGAMQLSLLTLLNLSATNYHNARMLGLGHIDTPDGTEQTKYIYLAEYHTLATLDIPGPTKPWQHLYMSPPTAKADERFPQLIEPLPVEYGLSVPSGTSQPLQITDAAGYIPFGQARYIRLKAKLTIDYSLYNSFFNPPFEFSSLDYSPPVFSGVEYRNQGDVNWQKPEISHDEDYKDASVGQDAETLVLPFYEGVTKPILIHKEVTEGTHEYACYAINIFSRASDVSTKIVQTDFTRFIKPNTLIPPHNAHVQLIQKEIPVILTSTNEQALLAGKSNSDKTLVRLSFYYSHLHDINYGFGDQIEIFFREELPRDTNGGVGQVQNGAAGTSFAWIDTQDYTYNSNAETVTPNIPPPLKNNFIGGVFVVNENRYTIEDIQLPFSNGNYPRFKLRKTEDRNTVNIGTNVSGITQTFEDINAVIGDLFLVVENMAKASTWDTPNPLPFKIAVGDASWTTRQDDYEDDNDELVEQKLRGVWDTAKITETSPGLYSVAFDNYILPDHPQYKKPADFPDDNSVDWYKGIIRVRRSGIDYTNKQRKALDVLQIIQNSGSNLELKIHDASYDLGDANKNILKGNNIEVNFYPGYKVYLHEDVSSGFSENTILPSGTDDSKKTIIGLRAVDTTTLDSASKPYTSRVGVPLILFAQADIEPGIPDKPAGPLFATEPDFYGKCNYTLTVQLGTDPFSVVFYRADVNAILNALYTHETIYGDIQGSQGIKDKLLPPDEDVLFTKRFQELVDGVLDNGAFPEYNGYRLPIPDNSDNGFDGSTMNQNDIKTAIHGAFTPLTEQPLIYSLISNDPDYIPKAKKQTIKDKYGKLLNPTDPEYDQAPMAKRLPGQQVQFTDFTLDGEMGKETVYFYCAREINKQMRMGEYGGIWGPVQLINTKAPEAPILKKMTTQLADLVTGANTAINFEINEYPVHQNIKQIDIYRAYTAVEALSPRTMPMVKSIDLSTATITDGTISFQDDFLLDPFIPYGEPLFYRLVALREVKYEDRRGDVIIKQIPSKPSSTLLTNIVDVFNPEPPSITETIASTANNQLSGLELAWTRTAYNAKYFLFKMNNTGNWNKLHEIKSNEVNDLKYAFSDPLPKVDDDNKPIYHRFKVTVENSSGLLNLTEDILTL